MTYALHLSAPPQSLLESTSTSIVKHNLVYIFIALRLKRFSIGREDGKKLESPAELCVLLLKSAAANLIPTKCCRLNITDMETLLVVVSFSSGIRSKLLRDREWLCNASWQRLWINNACRLSKCSIDFPFYLQLYPFSLSWIDFHICQNGTWSIHK